MPLAVEGGHGCHQTLTFKELKLDEYNDSLDPGEQIDTEEAIAAILHTADTESEENCAELGRGILKLVLLRFRPDLFAEDDQQ